MTICLLPHCGYLSETSRMLAIHDALVARGADVRVATHGGTHERLLREAGVAYDVVGPPLDDARCRELVRDGAGMGDPEQSMWTDDELRTYAIAEARYFAEHGVRIAVTGFSLTALLSTRLAGIPVACEHAGSFVPPVWEREMIEAPLSGPFPGAELLAEDVRRALVNAGTNHLQMHCGGFNRVADELGVEPVPSFAQLLLGDVTIVTEAPDVLGITAAELAAWRPTQPGYRPSTRLVPGGPIFARLDLELPDRVEQFLAGGGPIVYVAITSTTEAQVRATVAALRAGGLRLLVAATVHDLHDLDDGRDVVVASTLPSHRVMPRVDLAVTAGGQGSVQCAMAAGTPLIGLPLHVEQDFNVQVVERHGAGRRMTFTDAATPAIAALARQLLDDGDARAAAQRIRHVYDGLDGPGLAAEAILRAIT